MRIARIAAVALVLMILLPGVAERDSPSPENTSQEIFADRLVFPKGVPQPVLANKAPLRPVFLAGWELHSKNSNFGGLSGLVWQGGRQFHAISDTGYHIAFTLGAARQAEKSAIHRLPGLGRPGIGKYDRDSEGLTRDPGTGRYWVSFEQRHAIARYAPGFSREEALRRPPAMRDWPANGGAEAIVRLEDGRFLVFSERAVGPQEGSTMALLFSGDPLEASVRQRKISVFHPDGYAITAAAQLPDGRLMLLCRKFSLFAGFASSIAMVDLAEMDKTDSLHPQIIARLDGDFPSDNMEGMDVGMENGKLIMWMVSDDNFFPLQRTLLLKFRLDPVPAPQ